MKALIIYYSQTGNTQKAARRIRDGLMDAGWDVYVSALKDTKPEDLEGYDLVGLGSPIWYEMTPNMRRFVEALPDQKGKAAFSFCTHGTMPDLYFPLVIPRLQRTGFTVLDWAAWYGNCSIQIFPEPYYTHGHPDEIDLQNAFAFGRKVGRKAMAFVHGETVDIPEAPVPNMMPMHANAAIEHLGGFHNVHGKLVRDVNKCLYPKCHICVDNCTMGYINYEAEPPRFGNLGDCCDDCHGCTYCEMLCPVGAIHPEIPYEQAAPVGQDHGSQLFCTVLSKAENEGKFRRLINFEDVGTKTPFYSVHASHPRLRPLSVKEDNKED